MEADGRSRPIPGGVKCRLYSDFPWLYLQTDCRDAEFVPAPDWYYNFEYAREIERGYEGDEDLLTTGYFELSLGRRQSVISLRPSKPFPILRPSAECLRRL